LHATVAFPFNLLHLTGSYIDLERAIVSNMTFQFDLAFDGAGNLFLTGLAPPNGREAAILTTLPPGNFTAIDQSVRTASDGGVNQTRERWVYDLTLSFTRIGFQPQSLLGESGVEPARCDGDR